MSGLEEELSEVRQSFQRAEEELDSLRRQLAASEQNCSPRIPDSLSTAGQLAVERTLLIIDSVRQ